MHAYANELIDTAPDVAVADSTPAALAAGLMPVVELFSV
jgi:hypothetical protein